VSLGGRAYSARRHIHHFRAIEPRTALSRSRSPCQAATTTVAEAIAAEGYRVFELPSGAGHDGMAMIDIADVGMVFVRCRDGISHHPDEHVETSDADAGGQVLLRLIENFRARGGAE
jgi:acetylornithine deacetylase/succinyl-diaminopimelate desuccinylase-like protein